MKGIESTLQAALHARANSIPIEEEALVARAREITGSLDGVAVTHLSRFAPEPPTSLRNVRSLRYKPMWILASAAACALLLGAITLALVAPWQINNVRPAASASELLEAWARPQKAADLQSVSSLPVEVSATTVRLVGEANGTRFFVGSATDGRTCFSAVSADEQSGTCTMGGALTPDDYLSVQLQDPKLEAWLIPSSGNPQLAAEAGAQRVAANLWVTSK